MLSGRALHIQGIVQGVGFRPFVYGLAVRHQLGGWVLNNSSGVDIQVYGADASITKFIVELETRKPPLAVIDSITSAIISVPDEFAVASAAPVFRIRHSQAQLQAFAPISPDVATCADCLRELFDARDRRYRYPFTNCTNCGPRFTIVRDIPYDRPLTTMSAFEMCPACQAEYDDPANRRFHAQPNACPDCGPQLKLVIPGDAASRPARECSGDEALLAAQDLLDNGAIVAIKGLGGYHLACSAVDASALYTLRQRKGRVDKPFAVMAPSIEAIRSFAHMSDDESTLLLSRQRPIVLLRKRDDFWLSALVAPDNHMIGVMLPYTPMHHLLLEPDPESAAPRLYVMTSGNLSEEPIVKDNAEAETRLGPLADAFLHHNRNIHIHCDDSVVRSFRGKTISIRRSRGYAPAPIRLPVQTAPILAVGGELKNTFCLTSGAYVFMSQHIGDMENLETLQAFERTVDHFTRIFHVEPERLACDMHPAYLSTRWAQEFAAKHDLPLIEVQHHHAHIAAVLAENNLGPEDKVIGVALDGTGFGIDGSIWGGEILVASYSAFTRIGRLRPAPLPGGDAAIRRPYRTALAYLWDAAIDWDDALPPVQAASSEERRILRRQLETGLNCTATSSMGRFFDAVSAIAGIRQTISYEAQAAMEFESRATPNRGPCYDIAAVTLLPSQGGASLHSDHPELQFEFDTRPIVRQLVNDVVNATSPIDISTRFHNTVAILVREACRLARQSSGLNVAALSGGVFQNLRLLGAVLDILEQDGFTVLMHKQVPANDGGIALGQALIAHYAGEANLP